MDLCVYIIAQSIWT